MIGIVTNAEDLTQTLQQIDAYLRNEGLTVFYGYEELSPDHIAEIIWEKDDSGWKDFLQAAKQAGAKVVVVKSSLIEKDDLEQMLETQHETKITEDLEELKKHVGKVGHFSLFWYMDRVKYVFSQATEWWDRTSAQRTSPHIPARITEEEIEAPGYRIPATEIPDEIQRKTPEQLADEIVAFLDEVFPEARRIYGSEATGIIPHEVWQLFWERKGLPTTHVADPQTRIKIRRAQLMAADRMRNPGGRIEAKDLIEKSEEELAQELVDFVRKELPSKNQLISWRIVSLFWKSKGVERYDPLLSQDPKLQLKSDMVEDLARTKLEKEKQDRENELRAKLIDECVKWAMRNALKKVTKSDVDRFLSHKNQTLTQRGRNIIHAEANLVLARQLTPKV